VTLDWGASLFAPGRQVDAPASHAARGGPLHRAWPNDPDPAI